MTSQPLNILWISPFPHPNATGHPGPWLLTLSQALARTEGVRLTMLGCSTLIKQPVEEFTKGGIRYVYMKIPRGKLDTLTLFTVRVKRLRSYLARYAQTYDLIHVHGTEHQYHSALGVGPVPVVTSIQGVMSLYVKDLVKGMRYGYGTRLEVAKEFFDWTVAALYESAEVRRYQNYICRTIFDTGFVRRRVPNARIFPIWEMIREPFFRVTLEKPGDKILFVGGSQPLKGLREALIALHEIRKIRPMRMILLGVVNPVCLNRIIRDYRLINVTEDALDCRGFQDVAGLVAAMQESFCLLHPSYIDNSPNSVCEAQVAGLPVVATSVGGLPSLITDGVTGLLAPIDGRILAGKVLSLREDPALWHRVASASVAVARSRHDPETILRQTLDTYQTLITHESRLISV